MTPGARPPKKRVTGVTPESVARFAGLLADLAEAELADARPLGENAFKVELAKRVIGAVLGELAA